MTSLQREAQDLLDHYFRGVRVALSRCTGVDPGEVEREVREHVEHELAGASEPVSASRLRLVLDRLGQPFSWAGEVEPEQGRLRLSLPDFMLAPFDVACLAIGFLVLGLMIQGLWIPALVATFFAARAALAGRPPLTAGEASRDAILYPVLLAIYVPLALLLCLWPAVATRLLADEVLRLELMKPRFPAFALDVAERVSRIRLSNPDPIATLKAFVRSGHYLLLPAGVWLLMLGTAFVSSPRVPRLLFRPFLDAAPRRFGKWLLVASGLALLLAVLLVSSKLVRPV